MTKRIYVRGNPGDPSTMSIFDADTHRLLAGVHKLTTLVEAKAQPTAILDFVDGTTSVVDVVPGPPSPYLGKVLREVEVTSEHQGCPPAPSSRTVTRATMTEWDVQPDGTVAPNAATQAYQEHTVDDSMLAKYSGDPKDILEDSVRVVLTGIAHYLIQPLMSTGKTPLATGYRPGAPNLNIPVPPSSRTKTIYKSAPLECDECGGSGEYKSPITGAKSPCTRGCKQPPLAC